MLFEETGVFLPFYIVAVEKSAPHRVGVYELHQDVLHRAHLMNQEIIGRVRQCYKENVWPSGSIDGIKVVEMPHWVHLDDA